MPKVLDKHFQEKSPMVVSSELFLIVFAVVKGVLGICPELAVNFYNKSAHLYMLVQFLWWSAVVVASLVKGLNIYQKRFAGYTLSGSGEFAAACKECATTQDDTYKSLINNEKTVGRIEDRCKMLIDNLKKHLQKTLPQITKVDKQVFVSIYVTKGYFEGTLESAILKKVCVSDDVKFIMKSSEINLRSSTYKDYECVKCIKAQKSTVIQLDKNSYKKEKSERSSTVENYFGLSLMDGENQFIGFLNIEFHKIKCFKEHSDAEDYMLEEILAFKHILEYHLITEKIIRHHAK